MLQKHSTEPVHIYRREVYLDSVLLYGGYAPLASLSVFRDPKVRLVEAKLNGWTVVYHYRSVYDPKNNFTT